MSPHEDWSQFRSLGANETIQEGDWRCVVPLSRLSYKPEDRAGEYEPVKPYCIGQRPGIMGAGWQFIRRQ